MWSRRGRTKPISTATDMGGFGETSDAGTARKARRHLIPLLFLLYVVAYLDRVNVGFASLTMNRELALTSEQFGMLSGIFFFGFFFFFILPTPPSSTQKIT